MTEINRHNFEQAKNKIEQFSKSVPNLPTIEKFETNEGLFDLLDHHLTGKEMNDYVEKVQDVFINQNDVHRFDEIFF